MALLFREYDGQYEALADFLSSDEWPFHRTARMTAEQAQKSIGKLYAGEFIRSFWILHESESVGFIRLFDLGDPTPMFDLRIRSAYRGQGFGSESLAWLTSFVFTNFPDKLRFEGTTREDNIPMRRTFLKCGFVKEAHYRKAWPSESGEVFAAVGYSILKEDWEEKKTTPVDWDDTIHLVQAS